jgi:hypothetical protein
MALKGIDPVAEEWKRWVCPSYWRNLRCGASTCADGRLSDTNGTRLAVMPPCASVCAH